ncbi:MAG: porphobilinogen synthase [Halobacteriota archaeon]|nr:porphobilinogen synthase [Halobacteriota archaeon]
MYPQMRMRRLRKPRIRDLVRETELSVNDLIYPIFVDETIKKKREIESMPSQYRFPLDALIGEVKEIADIKIPAIILFGIPSKKDGLASSAYDPDGIVQRAIREVRSEVGDNIVIIADLCLCEYTDHGHCGIVKDGEVLNDPTLDLLGKTAVTYAEAGADIVAPSGMMDGMVQAIRATLDTEGFSDTIIMSYAAKYASSFYSPFRDAAESGYSFGDRRAYQMDIGNSDEAIREVELDLQEGADIVMVKPAISYLDILYRVKDIFGVPTAAYNVSGEYSMVKAAALNGWIDEKSVVQEMLLGIKRAGADMILTYFAKDVASELLNKTWAF